MKIDDSKKITIKEACNISDKPLGNAERKRAEIVEKEAEKYMDEFEKIKKWNLKRLDSFYELKDGWSDYDSCEIKAENIELARKLIENSNLILYPCPIFDGGVQLEYSDKCIEFEFVIIDGKIDPCLLFDIYDGCGNPIIQFTVDADE